MDLFQAIQPWLLINMEICAIIAILAMVTIIAVSQYFQIRVERMWRTGVEEKINTLLARSESPTRQISILQND